MLAETNLLFLLFSTTWFVVLHYTDESIVQESDISM